MQHNTSDNGHLPLILRKGGRKKKRKISHPEEVLESEVQLASHPKLGTDHINDTAELQCTCYGRIVGFCGIRPQCVRQIALTLRVSVGDKLT